MEEVLDVLLPQLVETPFHVRRFRGKHDLVKRIPQILPTYRGMGHGTRVLIVVDKDNDDCRSLKRGIVDDVEKAGLISMNTAAGTVGTVCVRVAVEELEAWFFGDVEAVIQAFPGVPVSLGARSRFRDPDAVRGGTAEAFQ